MKKNIGAKLALYPTPLVVVGTMVNGKPNWTLVGHLGIIGHDRVMVSMSDSHYSNQGIRAMKALSINIVDEAIGDLWDILALDDLSSVQHVAEPRFHDGDVILVSMTQPVEVGDIALITMDGCGYVKKLGEGKLISLNKRYAPIPMTEDIRINGKVIGVLAPDK